MDMNFVVMAASALGGAIGLGFAALGSGIGAGNATASALEAMARQPEEKGTIRTTLLIGLAIIESLTLYALVLALLPFVKH